MYISTYVFLTHISSIPWTNIISICRKLSEFLDDRIAHKLSGNNKLTFGL
jgi:hypothetical protein